jgi:predicted DCC family thiol-disulfide oxidoreductase YuxK
MMRIAGSEGWVLYDGDCPFCVRWLHFWEPVLCRRGFGIDKLQASWAAKALGMTADEAARDIRLVTQDGRAYSGADVYLQVAKKIWWAWAFEVLFSLPGFNRLIWAGYKWFAANRQCVSGYCARKV